MNALDLLAKRQLRTIYGVAEEFLFRYANEDVITLAFGEWRCRKVPVRVHSTCFSAHYLASVECDCREQLAVTVREMNALGRGIVIFLDQDGRGNGHAGLMRSADYASMASCTVGEAYEALGYPRDARTYHAVPLVLKFLGVTELTLFTNNPEKSVPLRDAGFILDIRSVVADPQDRRRLNGYYDGKRAEGHTIPRG
ncbi:MAG TPA: hypothetical protein VMA95_06205 [Streptosporangiaceae bacterium]|nr:hypothetical protein [Streptosporangiaceae bacterium]